MGNDFRFMPEPHWAYGLVWLAMIALPVTLGITLQRRGWIGRDPYRGCSTAFAALAVGLQP